MLPAGNAALRTPFHVLNLDAEGSSRETKSAALRHAGYVVSEAGSAADALEICASKAPHLVVLDLNVRDMNGLDLCRSIRQSGRQCAILMLDPTAGEIDDRRRVSGLEAGADVYLTEPVAQIVFLATARSLLRIRAVEEAAHQAHRRAQSILESITDSFVCIDRELRMVDINERAATTLFRRHREEMIGVMMTETFPAIVGSPLHEACQRVFASNEALHLEVRSVIAEGRWLEAHIYPSDGVVSLYMRDITDRKLAEEERTHLLAREREARRQAEAANRVKEEFLAIVSHELRSPMSAIIMWTRVLREAALDKDVLDRALEGIERSARLQTQLIEDLLDVSRITSGKLRLEMETVQLPSVVAHAVDAARASATAKGIALEVELDPGAAFVRGDVNRLQQIMWNLLSNAIKFTPNGGRIRVRLEIHGTTAKVTIADSGEGIPGDFLPHVFERFRQGDLSSTRRHSGLGLGLAIVGHLVELHGGRVTAESPGADLGSTFSVALPIVLLPSVLPQRDGARDVRARVSLAGLHVLVVDDEAETRESVATLLQQRGATTTIAASAAEARAAIGEGLPDVLVSDIGMPQEDGLTFIRSLRAEPPERGGAIPAAALTAFARPQDRSPAMAAGFHAHLSKPIDPEELVEAILELSGRK